MSSAEHRRPHAWAAALRDKPVRFKIGVLLLILYPLMYLLATIPIFLPMPAGAKAGLIAGTLAGAEGVFALGALCVGKEAVQSIKARFRRGKRGKPHGEVVEDAHQVE